jgi:dTDP-4-dehydrorhamnose reductase
VYGESKLEGERRIAERMDDYLVVRVQSLFGRHGRHFVSAICGKLQEGVRELRVVQDQVCAPTYTRHLAAALVGLMQSRHTGIVHVSASGHCSWHQFAVEIARRVAPDAIVHPVSTEEYPTPARRPAYARLDTTRYQAWMGSALPSWQNGLDDYLKEMET